MKVVIVGAGDTGVRLADELVRRGRDEVTLVECDDARAERVARDVDALVLAGDGAHPDLLRKAGLERADALVAVTGDDAINTVVAMLGRRFGVRRLVVRLWDVALRAACEEAGVTATITPTVTAVDAMLRTLYGAHLLDFSVTTQSGLRMSQIPVRVDDLRLGDLLLPEGARLVAVLREGQDLVLPRADMRVQAGDEALVLTESEPILDEVKARLGGGRARGRDQSSV